MRSMTGFGRAEHHGDGFSISWELRSINSRYLDLKWRTPSVLRALENDWEKQVREFAARGRVELTCQLRLDRADLAPANFNVAQARAMLGELRAFAQELGQDFAPDLSRFLTISSLWQDESAEPDPSLAQGATAALRQALAMLRTSREREGSALRQDLAERLTTLNSLKERIAELVPQVLAAKRTALEERIRTIMADQNLTYDAERMLQEIAVLTDRLDVSEELSRLQMHLKRFADLLDGKGEVGKRLDFLMQEIFREITTCGNKSQDAEVSRLTVDFKAELEKCREQIQNVE